MRNRSKIRKLAWLYNQRLPLDHEKLRLTPKQVAANTSVCAGNVYFQKKSEF